MTPGEKLPDSGTYTIDVNNPGAHKNVFSTYTFIKPPEQSEWQCYLFGNRPGGMGIIYRPNEGQEPNWLVRWFMRVCFDCLWVKNKSEKKT